MKCPCYTTSTGLRIGSMHDEPQRSYMTPEAERVQRALLTPGNPIRPRLCDLALYAASVVVGLFGLIVLLQP